MEGLNGTDSFPEEGDQSDAADPSVGGDGDVPGTGGEPNQAVSNLAGANVDGD